MFERPFTRKRIQRPKSLQDTYRIASNYFFQDINPVWIWNVPQMFQLILLCWAHLRVFTKDAIHECEWNLYECRAWKFQER